MRIIVRRKKAGLKNKKKCPKIQKCYCLNITHQMCKFPFFTMYDTTQCIPTKIRWDMTIIFSIFLELAIKLFCVVIFDNLVAYWVKKIFFLIKNGLNEKFYFKVVLEDCPFVG